MITNSSEPPTPAWLEDPGQDPTLDVPAAQAGRWSAALTGILRACLLYDPASRPTFDQIFEDSGCDG